MKNLPGEIIRSRPRLYSTYAYCVLMAGGHWDAAEAALRDAERMLGIGGGDVVEDEERAALDAHVGSRTIE